MVTDKRRPVETEDKFSRGGFQGILKIRGLLMDIVIEAAPDAWNKDKKEEDQKEVAKVSMEDTVILKMAEGETEFELKDGKFSFLMSYAKPGENPHKNSGYVKGWFESAKALGKKPSDFIGQYVTLERKDVELFESTNKETKEKKKVTANVFCFVADEKTDSTNVKAYVAELVVGLTPKAALKKLLTDNRAKQFPVYKDMLQNGTLAKELGLELVDGKFQKIETPKEKKNEKK